MKNNIIHKLHFKVLWYKEAPSERVRFDSTLKKFDNSKIRFDKKWE